MTLAIQVFFYIIEGMAIFELTISTSRSEELVDITDEVASAVGRSGIKEGLVHVFVPHATAGIILNESADPNIKTDFLNAIERAFPKKAHYLHDRIDQNAAAHIRSAVVGSSLTIPLVRGRMLLGTWQTIMFCEFDGPRSARRIIVQILPGSGLNI